MILSHFAEKYGILTVAKPPEAKHLMPLFTIKYGAVIAACPIHRIRHAVLEACMSCGPWASLGLIY
jgi:hypothetical protein